MLGRGLLRTLSRGLTRSLNSGGALGVETTDKLHKFYDRNAKPPRILITGIRGFFGRRVVFCFSILGWGECTLDRYGG